MTMILWGMQSDFIWSLVRLTARDISETKMLFMRCTAMGIMNTLKSQAKFRDQKVWTIIQPEQSQMICKKGLHSTQTQENSSCAHHKDNLIPELNVNSTAFPKLDSKASQIQSHKKTNLTKLRNNDQESKNRSMKCKLKKSSDETCDDFTIWKVQMENQTKISFDSPCPRKSSTTPRPMLTLCKRM